MARAILLQVQLFWTPSFLSNSLSFHTIKTLLHVYQHCQIQNHLPLSTSLSHEYESPLYRLYMRLFDPIISLTQCTSCHENIKMRPKYMSCALYSVQFTICMSLFDPIVCLTLCPGWHVKRCLPDTDIQTYTITRLTQCVGCHDNRCLPALWVSGVFYKETTDREIVATAHNVDKDIS